MDTSIRVSRTDFTQSMFSQPRRVIDNSSSSIMFPINHTTSFHNNSTDFPRYFHEKSKKKLPKQKHSLGVKRAVALAADVLPAPRVLHLPAPPRDRALLLVHLEVGPAREADPAPGAGKGPLARVAPQMVPQRRLAEALVAQWAAQLGRARIRAVVQGLVEQELRPGVAGERALGAAPLVRAAAGDLGLAGAAVLARVPRHVLREGELFAAVGASVGKA